MSFRVDQSAIIMLPVDLDQKSAQLTQQCCRNRLVVDESAAAAIGLDRAPDVDGRLTLPDALELTAASLIAHGSDYRHWVVACSGGKDSVYIEWELDCQGCPESGALGRSGQLTLQPDSFFDACLAQPDTASLIQCVFGFVDFQAGSPPPADFVPAFTTGECASLDAVCPG